MEPNREPELWGSEDDEYLTCTDENEAITYILDGYMSIKHLPETITVCGFARMIVNAGVLSPLEDLVEWLDQEYGGEDFSEITEKMKEAEKVFIAAVLEDYVPWQMEPVIKKEINVQEWIKEHELEWLENEE